MNVGLLLLMFIGGLAGVLSTLYLLISLPIVIIQKIYRKIRFGISIMNKKRFRPRTYRRAGILPEPCFRRSAAS